MRRFVSLSVLALALLLPATDAPAQWGVTFDDQKDWTVTFSGARVRQQIEGDLFWGQGIGNTELDVEGVLDMDDAETFAGRIDFQAAGAAFRLGYLPLQFEGDTVLTASQTLNGITYTAGDRVSSEMDIKNYEMAFGYKFRLGDHFMIAPLVQVNLLDGFLDSIDLDLPGSEVKEEFLVPIALAGLRMEVYPMPRLALFAEAKGFAAHSWGELSDADVLDGEVGLSFHLTRNLILTSSYRLNKVSFNLSDTEVDLDLSGLSLALDMRF
jgi:opacity protein-like surface antigen